jgi:hypothetical protein
MVIHRFVISMMTMLLLFVGTAALADSPKSTKGPDAHSVEATGKVVLYRVQIEGMNLGEGTDKVDAEVFVALDSDPKTVFALQLKHNAPDVNKAMADMLREAYFRKVPVTIYRQIDMKRTNNYKILMVQVN